VVPALVALKFSQASKGRLKFDPKVYTDSRKRPASHG